VEQKGRYQTTLGGLKVDAQMRILGVGLADEVHSLRGIAPLNPGEAESVAIHRLFVQKGRDKVVAEALK